MDLRSFDGVVPGLRDSRTYVSSALHYEMEGGGCEYSFFLRASPMLALTLDNDVGCVQEVRYKIDPVQHGHHLYFPGLELNEQLFPFGQSLAQEDALNVLSDYNAAIAPHDGARVYNLRSYVTVPDMQDVRHVSKSKHRGIAYVQDNMVVNFNPGAQANLLPPARHQRRFAGPR